MRVGDGEPISRRRNPRGQNDLGFTERFAKSGKAEEGWGRSPGVPLRRLCVTDGNRGAQTGFASAAEARGGGKSTTPQAERAGREPRGIAHSRMPDRRPGGRVCGRDHDRCQPHSDPPKTQAHTPRRRRSGPPRPRTLRKAISRSRRVGRTLSLSPPRGHSGLGWHRGATGG